MGTNDDLPNFDWLKGDSSKPAPPPPARDVPAFPGSPAAESPSAPKPAQSQPQTGSAAIQASESPESAEPSNTEGPSSEVPRQNIAELETTGQDAPEPETSESAFLDDMPALADPRMNESDGSTLVIKAHPFGEDPEAPVVEDFTPPAESDTDSEDPKNSGADAGTEEAQSEPEELTQAEATPADEAGEISSGDTPSEALTETEVYPEDEAGIAALPAAPTPSPIDTTIVLDSGEMPATPVPSDQTDVLKADELSALPKLWPGASLENAARTTGAGFGAAAFGAAANSPAATPAVPVKEAEAAAKTGPSRAFVLLASYASAVTLAFILMLLWDLTQTFSQHKLESLPDIPSEKVENLTYVPPHQTLPPGHRLNLGESRRFGNILVEPLRIVREPAEFVHYTGESKIKREPTAPVWKLWLKLTNVSDDQTIAPLDRQLILRWISKKRSSIDFTNNYITERNAKTRNVPQVQLFRLPAASDWDFKGEDLGKTLKPGESYETYLVASDEGLEDLGTDLVWRVQIRKGYSPKGHGVTTLFEVAFKKSDVPEATS